MVYETGADTVIKNSRVAKTFYCFCCCCLPAGSDADTPSSQTRPFHAVVASAYPAASIQFCLLVNIGKTKEIGPHPSAYTYFSENFIVCVCVCEWVCEGMRNGKNFKVYGKFKFRKLRGELNNQQFCCATIGF